MNEPGHIHTAPETVSWLVLRFVTRPVVAHARRKNTQQSQVSAGAECFLFSPEGPSTSAGAGPIYILPDM
jgi:hypothetical protein